MIGPKIPQVVKVNKRVIIAHRGIALRVTGTIINKTEPIAIIDTIIIVP